MAKPQLYFGSAVSSMDAKNRITIPAKFRSKFPATQDGKVLVYVMPGPDFPHLQVFDAEGGERRIAELTGSAGLPGEQQRRRQNLLSLVEQVEIDAQGRILIPRQHVDYAKLKSEAIVSGTGDHIQICDPEQAQEVNMPVKLDKLDPAQIAAIFDGQA